MTDPTRMSDSDAKLDDRLRKAFDASDEPVPAALRATILAHAKVIAAANADAQGLIPHTRTQAINDSRWHVAALAAAAVVAALIAWPLLDSYQRATLARNGARPALTTAPVLRSTRPDAVSAQVPPEAPKVAVHRPPPVAEATGSARLSPSNVAAQEPMAAADRSPAPSAEVRMTAPSVEVLSKEMASAPARRAAAAGAAPSADAADAHLSRTDLIDAVTSGDPERIRQSLETATDLDAVDAAGRTALTVATDRHALSTVRLLLAHGADPNVKSGSGETPLRIAQRKNFDDIAALLLSAGAHD